LSRPSYALLFADMDPAAASEVVTRLDAQKVDYRIDAGGRNIRVPEAMVDRLRIEFSAEGLPTSGRIGFEIFDRTNFGATEFLEHACTSRWPRSRSSARRSSRPRRRSS
jgi:flagellar M-ring protein FliF